MIVEQQTVLISWPDSAFSASERLQIPVVCACRSARGARSRHETTSARGRNGTSRPLAPRVTPRVCRIDPERTGMQTVMTGLR